MTTTAYGTQVSGTTRDVGQSESIKAGAVYEATYAISGIRTVIPGWETDAINQVYSTIVSNGGQVVYIGISGNNVVVQWTHATASATSANAHAVVIPLLVYGIVAAILIVLAVWLIVTLTGSVKEITTLVSDNPYAAVLVYGGLAVLALFAWGYISRGEGQGSGG